MPSKKNSSLFSIHAWFVTWKRRSDWCSATGRASRCARHVWISNSTSLERSKVGISPTPRSSRLLKIKLFCYILDFSEQQVTGKDITPFLLQRVNEITDGKSLESSKSTQTVQTVTRFQKYKCDLILDMTLIKHNAAVGARVACALEAIRSRSASSRLRPTAFSCSSPQHQFVAPQIQIKTAKEYSSPVSYHYWTILFVCFKWFTYLLCL